MADYTLADLLQGRLRNPLTGSDTTMWWSTPPATLGGDVGDPHMRPTTAFGKGSVQQITAPPLGQHNLLQQWVPAAIGPQKGVALARVANALVGAAGRVIGLESLARWRGEDSPSSTALESWRQFQDLHQRRFEMDMALSRMGMDRETTRRLVWGHPTNYYHDEFPVIEGPTGERF